MTDHFLTGNLNGCYGQSYLTKFLQTSSGKPKLISQIQKQLNSFSCQTKVPKWTVSMFWPCHWTTY